MKILFWVPYPPEGASNRYRVEQYLPFLAKAGIEYELRPVWNKQAFKVLYKQGAYLKKIYFLLLGTFSRFFDLFLIYRYDVVFIHREAYPLGGAFFETALRIFHKPFIYDFDDAIFLPSSSRHNIFAEKLKNPKKISRIIKMSSYCIAGNQYLLDFALKYTNNVCVIPTAIDTSKYSPAPGKKQKEVVVGWIGSVTTCEFLVMLKDVFIELSQRFTSVIFKIIGSDFSVNGISNIISGPWSFDAENSQLKSFDIGIMPMPDNDWTKGKCGFKAILYMSMGIPCVCSPVGANKEIISDGINGFLAEGRQEWIDKLSLLILDSGLRQRIGAAARKTVEDKYSIAANADKFLKCCNRFLNLGIKERFKCAGYAGL